MALLDTHLKEIELCSSTIADLPFAPTKIFTNALLHTQDITALIRDTEPHEQPLFSLAGAQDQNASRESVHPNDVFKAPRKNTAVAAVLGTGMAKRLRQERAKRSSTNKNTADIDINLLLEGAQRLCSVYSMPGAAEKISSLRNRHRKALSSIQYYQGLVAEQNTLLKQMNRPTSRTSLYDDDDVDHEAESGSHHRPSTAEQQDTTIVIPPREVDDFPMTEEDLAREEESIRELERKKQTLEERVTGMERDLGGILG